jgi:hypothetical protein
MLPRWRRLKTCVNLSIIWARSLIEPVTWIGEGVLARSSTYRTLIGGPGPGAGAMLVAYRLAGLSALGAHYAGVKWRAMRDKRLRPTPSFRGSAARDRKAVEKAIGSRRRVGRIAGRGVPPAPSGGARKKGTGG